MGFCLNIKMVSYRYIYKYSHYQDKMVIENVLSLKWESLYLERCPLYWNRVQMSWCHFSRSVAQRVHGCIENAVVSPVCQRDPDLSSPPHTSLGQRKCLISTRPVRGKCLWDCREKKNYIIWSWIFAQELICIWEMIENMSIFSCFLNKIQHDKG